MLDISMLNSREANCQIPFCLPTESLHVESHKLTPLLSASFRPGPSVTRQAVPYRNTSADLRIFFIPARVLAFLGGEVV